MTYVELSHPLRNGMTPYPGLPAPVFDAVVDHDTSRPRYDDKAEFYLGRIEMATNVGTYIDSPFHRYRDGDDLAAIALERCAGLPAVVVDARIEDRAIQLEDLKAPQAAAILVRTGWSERWGTDAYWEPGPYLSLDSIPRLIAAKPSLVGVDCWNVDDTEGDKARPVHTALLAEGILIVEHMTGLDRLPTSGSRFYAVPLAIEGGASIPVRAFAEVDRSP